MTTTAEAATAPAQTIQVQSAMQHYLNSLWISVVQVDWSPYLTTPLVFLFVLPVFLCLCVYFSAFVVYVYLNWTRLRGRLWAAVIEEHDFNKAAREIIVTIWDAQGWIWFGYEVDGLENIPSEGPALILYYHGALPVDYYYFVAKVIQQRSRVVHSVVDRFLFKLWGMKNFLKAFNCTPGSVESCTEQLNEGHLLGLSPGGVYEAQFGDSNYEILWKDRLGFARIALGVTKQPLKIIPIFTPNIRESFKTFSGFKSIFMWLYHKTRLPLVPIWGGFPVKLKTIVGPPVEYDPDNCTPEQLRDLCKASMQKLIDDNQKKPGSIFRALSHRCSGEPNHYQ